MNYVPWIIMAVLVLVILYTVRTPVHTKPLFRRSKSKIQGNGEWESHPCVLPERSNMITSQETVWRCVCGRRWKYLYRDSQGARRWVEWTPEKELADANEQLRRMKEN